jgi:hypothetical protein
MRRLLAEIRTSTTPPGGLIDELRARRRSLRDGVWWSPP